MPMECWHPIVVRVETPSVVQRWAGLEGKSASMRNELAQRYESLSLSDRLSCVNWFYRCEMIAIAVKAGWRMYGS